MKSAILRSEKRINALSRKNIELEMQLVEKDELINKFLIPDVVTNRAFSRERQLQKFERAQDNAFRTLLNGKLPCLRVLKDKAQINKVFCDPDLCDTSLSCTIKKDIIVEKYNCEFRPFCEILTKKAPVRTVNKKTGKITVRKSRGDNIPIKKSFPRFGKAVYEIGEKVFTCQYTNWEDYKDTINVRSGGYRNAMQAAGAEKGQVSGLIHFDTMHAKLGL